MHVKERKSMIKGGEEGEERGGERGRGGKEREGKRGEGRGGGRGRKGKGRRRKKKRNLVSFPTSVDNKNNNV